MKHCFFFFFLFLITELAEQINHLSWIPEGSISHPQQTARCLQMLTHRSRRAAWNVANCSTSWRLRSTGGSLFFKPQYLKLKKAVRLPVPWNFQKDWRMKVDRPFGKIYRKKDRRMKADRLFCWNFQKERPKKESWSSVWRNLQKY